MKKGKNLLSYIKFNLFEAITTLAITSGSKGERLEKAFDSSIYKLFGSQMYLEAMSEKSAQLYEELYNTYKNIYTEAYKKFEVETGKHLDFNIRPLKFLHYKKANKIIKLVIDFYESICNDFYS